MNTTTTNMEGQQHECRSCGFTFEGIYCNRCGEKVMRPAEKSMRTFLTALVHDITSVDGKFLKTLKLMLKRPGEVSYQYMNGRRIPYYKPVSMFFIANLLYFLFPLVTGLNTPLYDQMHSLPHSALAREMVSTHLQSAQVSLETFTIQYNQQSTSMAKIFLILLVAYFSVPLSFININKRMYYSDHLLVSLEATSLVVLLNFVGLMWLMNAVTRVAGWMGANLMFLLNDHNLSWFSAALLIYLFYQMERRAYSEVIWRAVLKAILLVGGFFLALQVYRASLFFITLWSL